MMGSGALVIRNMKPTISQLTEKASPSEITPKTCTLFISIVPACKQAVAETDKTVRSNQIQLISIWDR